MMKAYRYVKVCCGICKKRDSCINFERIQRNEVINYKTLKDMANCPVWDPESKKTRGEK